MSLWGKYCFLIYFEWFYLWLLNSSQIKSNSRFFYVKLIFNSSGPFGQFLFRSYALVLKECLAFFLSFFFFLNRKHHLFWKQCETTGDMHHRWHQGEMRSCRSGRVPPFVHLSRDHLLHLCPQINRHIFFMVEVGLYFEPDWVLKSGSPPRSWELDVSFSIAVVCFRDNFNTFIL